MMAKGRARRRNGNGNKGGNTTGGPPARTLTRTFRYMERFSLNNTTGSGDDQYAYYSKYITFNPEKAFGFRDAKRTFELWRAKRARVYIQPGYNDYNQSYNTINLASALATTVWTAADYGINETISGVDLMSYHNARFHSLSINNYKKLIDTSLRINNTNDSSIPVFPASTWLDTSLDMTGVKYSGFQIFTMMQGMNSTNYFPKYQMVVEIDCEFKQPAWQNISTSFESEAFTATLDCEVTDDERRLFNLVKVTRQDGTCTIRFERADGQPGSLEYSATEFYEVWATGKNTPNYFNGRPVSYTGPVPPRHNN